MAGTEAPAPKGGGNVFTRHIGPLPMWGWVTIIGGGIVAWSFMSNQSANQASQTAGNTAAPLVITTPPSQDDEDSGDKRGPVHHHHRHKHRKHPDDDDKHPDKRDWDRGDPGYDAYTRYLREHGKPPPHGKPPASSRHEHRA